MYNIKMYQNLLNLKIFFENIETTQNNSSYVYLCKIPILLNKELFS